MPMMGIMMIIPFVMFMVILGIIISQSVKSARENRMNDNSPIQNAPATVVTKRTEVWGHEHAHTDYYVTFQFESGERMEFQVEGIDYGMLAEDDYGTLQYQGTRYLGFFR